MQIVVVENEQLANEWLLFPLEIYKNDPNYIRPLDNDIKEVFDKDKNKYYKTGECERWLLQKDNKYIGRIAVFTSKKWKNEQPTGGVGFFECIDSQEAANFLFDKAKEWLQARGMEAMDGNINFGERDKWWGLLVKGFEEPLYNMNYNPEYYVALFENYGFQVYFNQVCPGLGVDAQMSDKMLKYHKIYADDPDFEAVHIRKKELDKFAEDFSTVYNKAFAQHGDGKRIEPRQARFMFKKMKDVIDEKITWFVYHKGEPIAMWINIPDLNQYFKHLNGKLGWWQKIQFVILKARKVCKRFVGVAYGVVPEFQGKGTDAYMIIECAKVVQPSKRYLKYEMQWLGDFNPKMINLAKNMDAEEVRRLSTYRYLFDRTIEFKRHPIL